VPLNNICTALFDTASLAYAWTSKSPRRSWRPTSDRWVLICVISLKRKKLLVDYVAVQGGKSETSMLSGPREIGSVFDSYFDKISTTLTVFSRDHFSCLETYSRSRSAAISASLSRSHLDL
jgi:hypothetical protein